MTPDPEARAAMVEAALKTYWGRYYDPNDADQGLRRSMAKALTVAMRAAEVRGFKLVGPEATEEMLVAMEAAPCGDPDGGETGAFWGPMWTDAQSAAPKWEDRK